MLLRAMSMSVLMVQPARGFMRCGKTGVRSESRSRVWAAVWRLRASVSLAEEVDPGMVAGLEIVKYPHPALRAASVEIGTSELDAAATLSRRMLELMYEANGVGLAAPQVGINKRLMVFNPEGKKERWLDEVVLINPRIVASADGKETDVEGCLSFPGMSGNVERSKWVKVEAMNTKGKPVKKKYSGWVARIFQHEYDHLDGVVYVDRVPDRERDELRPKLDELCSAYDEATHGPAAP
mmetsp:Transcript_4837/g.14655  ORF Transcript_4837/g.14655 Transcript_4837/m.14655 type:complete len:238 (+) Transcript_4837:842-1555(+)